MHTTRQRTKSSFTVEIRRASKRPPAALALPRIAPDGEDGLESAFGGLGASLEPRWKERLRAGPPVAPQSDAGRPLGGAETAPADAPQQPLRRILPDLRAVAVDPVQERLKERAEGRAARRRATPDRRPVEPLALPAAKAAVEGAVSAALAAELAPASASDVAEAAAQAPDLPNGTSQRGTRLAPRKASRGGDAPVFRAGERWKRRLPRACW